MGVMSTLCDQFFLGACHIVATNKMQLAISKYGCWLGCIILIILVVLHGQLID